MSLTEFVMAVKRHCTDIHGDRICVKCKPVVMAANEIVEKGIVPLSVLYRKFFGTVYKSDKAIRHLLQFPVIIFRSFNQLFVTNLWITLILFSVFLNISPTKICRLEWTNKACS